MVKNRFIERIFGKTVKERVFHSINYLVFLIVIVIMLYPFIHTLQVSLTTYKNVGGVLEPQASLMAYKYLLSRSDIYTSFLLTILITVATTVAHLVVTLPAAFALSRKTLFGRKFWIIFVLITYLFGGGLIPFYLLMRDLHLRNTVWIYILPAVTNAYNIIIAKNFFASIPVDIEEAAKLDGANSFTIFFRMYVPLSIPIIAVISLWVAVGKWNDWFTGELYISNPQLLLFSNILRQMLVVESGLNNPGFNADSLFALGENIKMATAVVAIIPLLCIFPLFQKYFVKGVILGSVKE